MMIKNICRCFSSDNVFPVDRVKLFDNTDFVINTPIDMISYNDCHENLYH